MKEIKKNLQKSKNNDIIIIRKNIYRDGKYE